MDRACGIHREVKNAHKVLVGKPEGKRHLEDLHVDGRIVLECILGMVGRCGVDASSSGYGPVRAVLYTVMNLGVA